MDKDFYDNVTVSLSKIHSMHLILLSTFTNTPDAMLIGCMVLRNTKELMHMTGMEKL